MGSLCREIVHIRILSFKGQNAGVEIVIAGKGIDKRLGVRQILIS